MAVTMSDKRAIVVAFVMSVVGDRLKNFQAEVFAHWQAIAKEVFDSTFVQQANAIADVMSIDTRIRQLVMPGIGYGISRDSTFLREVTHLYDENFYSPSFLSWQENIAGMVYDQMEKMWKELSKENELTFQLPSPIRVLTAPPVDEGDETCHLDDGHEGDDEYLNVVVSSYVPDDCTTQKSFKKTGKKITDSAIDLAEEMFSLIRTCRSEEAIVKAVPYLKPFLCVEASKDTANNIDKLLEQARNG